MTQILPVILCGGSGTRLWPLSREHFPKQFITLFGQASLFQQTLQRLDGIPNVLDPVIIGNEEHRFLAQQQLKHIGRDAQVMILEPIGRNTAPALSLAALWAKEQNDVLLLVMPSDHVIVNVPKFHEALRAGVPLAEAGKIVTFGIKPTGPETGYGYIQAQDEVILAFKEKPDLETAKAYLKEGEYLWNSGIFLCDPEIWLAELQKYAPQIRDDCSKAMIAGQSDQRFFRPNAEFFQICPAISIDYAVMEKTPNAVVIPLDAGWSDMGSWSALQSVGDEDEFGNNIEGDVLAWESQGNYLKSTSRLVTTLGVDNLIIVETPDAILVASKEHAQEVGAIVSALKSSKRVEVENHRKVARPWGYFETVDQGNGFQVKRITVQPGQSLSLQTHRHRSEHWVIVKGTARVTCGEKVFLLYENQSTYIPQGSKHRLENPGTIDLELIEIQAGSYLGEDDIIRYEDIYQRR